jgi:hypothetical protein
MSKPAPPSLMDNIEFQEQLQRLVDAPLAVPGRAAQRQMNAYDSLHIPGEDDPLPHRAEAASEFDSATWYQDRAEWDAPVASQEGDEPSTGAPRGITALVVMLGAATGASMSAAIFHERLAHVIALFAR